MSKWELDAAQPDIGNVVALSGIFGVTTDYLLKDEGESAEPAEKKGGRKKLAGIICALIGAVCIFLTYVISRFVPVMTPIRVLNNGQWQNHWNPEHVEVNYFYFIKEYELQLLRALFGILMLVGIVLMLRYRYRNGFLKRSGGGRKSYD